MSAYHPRTKGVHRPREGKSLVRHTPEGTYIKHGDKVSKAMGVDPETEIFYPSLHRYYHWRTVSDEDRERLEREIGAPFVKGEEQ